MLLTLTLDHILAIGLVDARLEDHGRILRLNFTNRTETWLRIGRTPPASREILQFRGQLYVLLTTGAEVVH
jgi:hypothetical protein